MLGTSSAFQDDVVFEVSEEAGLGGGSSLRVAMCGRLGKPVDVTSWPGGSTEELRWWCRGEGGGLSGGVCEGDGVVGMLQCGVLGG